MSKQKEKLHNSLDTILLIFAKGDFHGALKEINSLINEFQDEAILFNIKGACYAGVGQLDIAVENYEKAIEINPDYAKAYYNLAGAFEEQNKYDKAVQAYKKSISLEPENPQAHNNLGNVYKDLEKYTDAIHSYEQALRNQPDYIEAYYSLGSTLQDIGKLDEAIEYFKKVLQLKPSFNEINNILGNIFKELRMFEEAIQSYEKAIAINPNFFEVYYNLGITFQDMNEFNNAVKNYKKSIEVKEDYPEAHNNLGVAYKELKEYDSAIKSYQRAISHRPDYADAHNNLGTAFKELGYIENAIKSYEEALSIIPDFADAHFNLGMIYMDLGQFDLAVESYKKAIESDINFTEALNNLGIVLMDLGQLEEAENYFKKAVAINPEDSLAFNNLGIVYQRLRVFEESVKCFEKAIKINPYYVDAFSNFGNVLTDKGAFDMALAKYQHAYELNPSLDYGLDNVLHAKMHMCMWDNLSIQLDELKNKIKDEKKVIGPFAFMALVDDPELQKKTSEIYAKNKFPRSNIFKKIDRYPLHKKIRIGYFSGDFREHPVSTLTVNLYEMHNRDQFEIYAFSYGPDTQDEMNLRVKAGVDYFYEVQKMPHKDLVELAREREIDIAVDLGGYTDGGRPDIFAMSVAPIQISYIGFLGTMGSNYYDYLISDLTIIPKDNQKYYSEKIIYLPNFQANDSKQSNSVTTFSRKDLGLPENTFVFCCFNNTYKFTPSTFDSWARILKNVKESVLLIYASNKTAEKNLAKEIARRGIDPIRLIFGKHLPRAEYLGRYKVVDLFLDTNPYNAGTTSSDAMRMGLPVITLKGQSFSSRMGASILNGVDLPELIASSREEYEFLAIELANNPDKLKIIRDKLLKNLSRAPLFNTKLFATNIELAYTKIYKRHNEGLGPDHIYV